MTVDDLGQSEADERGEAVEAKWRMLLQESATEARLVEAAYAEPKLRQLFPFTSLRALLFSQCTDYPYTWDIPLIEPRGDGRYLVMAADRVTSLGETDGAAEAVALVVAHLPADVGPAVAGSADDVSGAHRGER
jgi:hypothetical protein